MPQPRNGLRRRLARQVREASLRATPSQHLHISQLVRQVQAGQLAVPDACLEVTGILRAQNLGQRQATERRAA